MSTPATSRKARWPWAVRCYIGGLLAYGALLANWVLEILRLSSDSANYAVMLAGLSIPLFLMPLAFWLKGWEWKVVGAAFAVPLVVLSLVLGFFAFAFLRDIHNTGRDPSFERMNSVRLTHSQVALYRTNGGATTSFGVAVRQEKVLLPGVLLVRRLRTFYPAYAAEVRVLGDEIVRVLVAPYEPDQPAQEETYHLNRWVYM